MLSPFKILCIIALLAVFSSTIFKNPSLPLLVTHLGDNQMAVGVVAGISAFTGILFSFEKRYSHPGTSLSQYHVGNESDR